MKGMGGRMKRVGIVGSRTEVNRRKIREFVFKLKEQLGEKASREWWTETYPMVSKMS